MRLPLSGTAVVRPIKALPLVRKRLCSTANDVTKTALREENHTFIDKAKLLLPQAGVIAGGIVVAYGISKMGMFMTVLLACGQIKAHTSSWLPSYVCHWHYDVHHIHSGWRCWLWRYGCCRQ